MQPSSISGRSIPRLAMINDFTGFGRCSTVISLPVISIMGVQVCPVPTSILSNHLGFPTSYFDDYTPQIRDYLHGWEQLGIRFDGLYCGFLGSVEQISIVRELLSGPLLRNQERKALFLLDPVLGDHGNAYSTITESHCAGMRELIQYADILTPNITEACLLTETPYKEDGWTDYELEIMCRRLAGAAPGHAGRISGAPSPSSERTVPSAPARRIVITGLRRQNTFLNYIWEDGLRSTYETPVTGASRPGTGDLFASILAADAMNGVPFRHSVQKAADFVALCIQGTDKAGIPIQEGVLLERYLDRLVLQETRKLT